MNKDSEREIDNRAINLEDLEHSNETSFDHLDILQEGNDSDLR